MIKLDTAVILAAGYGSRMGAFTQTTPKPLVHFNNRPMIETMLDKLSEAGIKHLLINAHYLSEQLIDYFKNPTAYNFLSINIIVEEVLLETGGGVKAMLPKLPPHFLVVNCDNAWLEPSGTMPLINSMMQEFNPLLMDGLLATLPLSLSHGYQGAGDFIYDQDQIMPARKIKRGAGEVFMGVQILNHSGFENLHSQSKFSLNLVYDVLISKQRLYGISFKHNWFHIGDPESLALAQNYFKNLSTK